MVLSLSDERIHLETWTAASHVQKTDSTVWRELNSMRITDFLDKVFGIEVMVAMLCRRTVA
jgi:hypothetical protein